MPSKALAQSREIVMLDLLLILLVVAFFALSWGFVRLCEKL